MDTGTLATALAVVQEGSVRGAARLIGRAPSSVGDAFERLEAELALTLASRRDGTFSLTPAGENMARSADAFAAIFRAMAKIAGPEVPGVEEALVWATRNALPIIALSHYLVVVRTGSIRRAAAELGIGQPNLSRQMTRIERVLGCPLLIRTAAGCEPSPAGLDFHEAALALTSRLSSLTGSAGTRFARHIRTVKLGTIIPVGHESRLAARLARLVAEWRGEEGGHSLFVSSTTAEDLIDGLRSGRFDVALTDIAVRQKGFESQEIFSSELVLVGASGLVSPGCDLSALVGRHRIAVPSLRSGLRQKIGDTLGPYLGGDGRSAVRLVEVDALSIIINLVLDHGFLTILPIDAVTALGARICTLPLPGTPRIAFHLVWQRTQPARKLAMQIAARLETA